MDSPLLITSIIILISAVGLSWFAGTDAPYVPTKHPSLKDILKAAGLKKGSIFYELGSGDGRVSLLAAKMGAVAHGVEQSWIRVGMARRKAQRQQLKDVHFFHGNLFSRNYYPADVVYIYLLADSTAKLEKKLKEELKPGATVITQRYHFKHWKPFKQIDDFCIYQQK